jgi:hypothetical protein
MHLCFAIPWRTSWKPFAMIFHMIWTHVWLSLFHYSWSSVCVCFHVITWLLSSYCQDYVFYAHVLSSLIPVLNAYYDDQDCDGACHLENYSLVITYLLGDEKELSLGMLDTSQTYLYFLMLHACLYTICFVFCYTLWHFYAFSGTNLLTRCHRASSMFSAVFVFQKSYTRNILGIGRNKIWTSYFLPKLHEDRRWDGGGQGPASLQGGVA